MSVTLIISSGDGLIGRVEDYDGPVPRIGECIRFPSRGDRYDTTPDPGLGLMPVRSVTYDILARQDDERKHFVGRPFRIVEVQV